MNIPDKEIFINNRHKLDPRVCRKLWPEFYEFLQSEYPGLRISEQLWLYYNGPAKGCLKCGNPTRYISFNNGYCNYCSDCVGAVRAEHAMQTIKKRYGTCNMAHIPGATDKAKQTKLKKYGSAGYNNHDKAVKTCEERYGGFGQASEIIKNKSMQTRLEKYGDPSYTNREKCKETCRTRYDVDYSYQTEIMKEHARQTKIEKYGDPSYTNRRKSVKTFRRTQIDRKDFLLGYTPNGQWICKCTDPNCSLCTDRVYTTPTAIYQNRKYQNIETCTTKCPIGSVEIGISHISKSFFEKISQSHKYQAVTEYKIGPYRVDYYIPELNIIIEFNGDYWHANPKLYGKEWVNPTNGQTAAQLWSKDLKRLNYFTSKGYKVFTVWESDYLKYDKLSDILNQ